MEVIACRHGRKSFSIEEMEKETKKKKKRNELVYKIIVPCIVLNIG